jgi:tetratricopeptide (TPR) repeat protein
MVPRIGFAVRDSIVPRAKRTACYFAFVALSACATAPDPSAAPPQPAPAIASMNEWLARGDSAAAQGDHTKARNAWRAATKDYPTEKQPWLKLSEDYFNAGDYGNAVLAAQEALQRDPHDRLANSVLAVSGLRLTAGSLAALRDGGTYAVGSRDEAVSVTHQLREALGEPVLVPPADGAAARKRIAKPRPRPQAEGGTVPAPPAATAVAPGPKGLDKLK